jgi:hypothetical protein
VLQEIPANSNGSISIGFGTGFAAEAPRFPSEACRPAPRWSSSTAGARRRMGSRMTSPTIS